MTISKSTMNDELKDRFEELVKQEKGTIYSICLMFAPDRDQADDLAQETLVNLWLGLPKFRGDSSSHTWVYRVTLNTCITYERKKKRQPDKADLIEVSLSDEESDDSENARRLHRRIQSLERFDRAIILLWLEGLPYDEIGDIVGISANAVGVRLVRIREKLKKINN